MDMDLFSLPRDNTAGSVNLAARNGDSDQLHQLISQGLSVNIRDNRGWSALHEATTPKSQAKAAECMKLLLQTDVGYTLLNWRNHEGETALFLTCQNCGSSVDLLLEAGADVNLSNNEGVTPLVKALQSKTKSSRRRHAAEQLLSYGASPDKADDLSQWTAQHETAQLGDLYLFNLVAFHSTDENPRDVHGRSPLHVAAQYGNQNCMAVILKSSDAVAEHELSSVGETGDSQAASKDRIISSDNSLQAQDSIDSSSGSGEGTEEGEILETRSEVSNVANVLEDKGRTPLFLAVLNKHVKCAELLIKRGCDLWVTNDDGLMAIHLAYEIPETHARSNFTADNVIRMVDLLLLRTGFDALKQNRFCNLFEEALHADRTKSIGKNIILLMHLINTFAKLGWPAEEYVKELRRIPIPHDADHWGDAFYGHNQLFFPYVWSPAHLVLYHAVENWSSCYLTPISLLLEKGGMNGKAMSLHMLDVWYLLILAGPTSQRIECCSNNMYRQLVIMFLSHTNFQEFPIPNHSLCLLRRFLKSVQLDENKLMEFNLLLKAGLRPDQMHGTFQCGIVHTLPSSVRGVRDTYKHAETLLRRTLDFSAVFHVCQRCRHAYPQVSSDYPQGPAPLKNLCRLSIRSTLPTKCLIDEKFANILESLSLPSSIISYLIYSDIEVCDFC